MNLALLTMLISNLVYMTRFWKNLHQVTLVGKISGKSHNIKVIGSKKFKEPKQDSQNWIR